MARQLLMVDFHRRSTENRHSIFQPDIVTGIALRLEQLLARIRECEGRHGRPPGSVRLLPASKGQPMARIAEARRLGVTGFGESYLQEALGKIDQAPDCQWHFIGPLQSNKTRGIAENFHWVQSVARTRIARRLNDQRPKESPPLNVCVQVNLSGEASKSGVAPADAEMLCREVNRLPRLRLRGLMTIPARVEGEDAQRLAFRKLAAEFRRLQRTFSEMDTLSMGMSRDFEAAIAEGATMVRLGTALFGARNPQA